MEDSLNIGKYCDVNRFISKENVSEFKEEQNSCNISNVEKMYSILYHGLTIRFGLNPTTSNLLATILSLSKKYGYCEASQGTFSKILGISIPTVKDALDELLSKELIKRSEKVGRYKTYKWKVTEKVEQSVRLIQQQIEMRRKSKE